MPEYITGPEKSPAPGAAPDTYAELSGLLDQVISELDDVETALKRLDEGTFANCEVCGEAISAETRSASPTTRRCANHANL